MKAPLLGAAAALLAGFSLAGCEKVSQAMTGTAPAAQIPETAYPERVLWGDLHLHTANSVDAFGFGNRLGPEEALRFARGEEVTSSTGIKARLARPLDFVVITDHAEGMGSTMALYNAPRIMIRDPQVLRWYDMMHEGPRQSVAAMAEILAARANNTLPPMFRDPKASAERTHNVWNTHLGVVERYNEPGKFTAMMGFEYTLMQGGNNLHRNVIFRDGKDLVSQVDPLDPTNEATPDKLWDYMDAYQAKTGGKVLAIPHNSNVSNGLMFMMTDGAGQPMTAAWARRRAEKEPVVEITQIKGDSEAHPFLSPNDEFAGYGTAGWDIGNLMLNEAKKPEMFAAEYVREALKRGLALEAKLGANPYKFGLIGSTDSHTSLSTGDENNFFGKHSGNEPGPTRAMGSQSLGTRLGRFGWQYLAGGYAGVWAKANTRAAIWDALARREVYATTGPRMTVRFFGGAGFTAADLKSDWVKAGYARGVPMGGSLALGAGGRPSFIVSALKDPDGANLDRVQVVKGWVDAAGKLHEKIFDVVWSDMERRQASGGKVPAVGDTVDLARASYTNSIGAPALSTVWADPEFDPRFRAFYYLRVLEIPTPTWPAYDALRFKLKLGPEVIQKAQERAYSSPIWYSPAGPA
ncbi:uncharacterized protein DUF3604 [Novosphingobium kunmingense]|uniref:Uncharacterized protein DUF3604 n=1 Tax=Novosphingobium kunmingense TaxID=1211806 RepID=A0A2N0I251_9SPHN|nr:DUF3604 domain-containing protein [Novosphingobium kunmingense]PKB25266.1 uncharacterized protein DUF3604 [Novosphingobium kunmingense]